MFYLALVIPCYNEESRIKPTFVAYFDYFSNSPNFKNKKIAIILVNDGSKDKTAEIIEQFEDFSNETITVKTVSYEQNQGKGAAIKRGCETVDSQIYGFVDADLSFKPELTEKALSFLNYSDFDLMIGQRNHNKNETLYLKLRDFLSKLLRRMINSFLAIPNFDTQCGFKFFKRNIVKEILPQIKQFRFSFDIELIILAKQTGHEIKTFPVNFKHHNESTITWKDGVRYLLDTVSISEQHKTVEFTGLVLRLFLFTTIISLFVYGWVIFEGHLFSDDFTWLWYGQKINKSLINLLTFRMSTFYSPVMNAFYSIMYSVFHYNPQPLFIIGILVHILASLFSGIFAWQLSKSKLIAIIVSVLAAFAGVAYEPLVWIGANMHSFVTLFILSSLICYYHYLSTKKNLYLALTFLCFVFALGTKESAIITPILLLASYIIYKIEHKMVLSKANTVFWIGTILLSGIYLYQQFLWQKNGIWVQSGIWDINVTSFFRIPLIIFDNFIPISFLKAYLTTWSAGVLWLFSLTFLTFILYQFRKLKLIWFGFLWLLISISPFIFFKTEFWWEPLASRYNYVSRIGAIIIIATILRHLIVHNKARYIINSLIYMVIITIAVQLYFMAKTITTEYDYVYNTGRSLTQAMQKIDEINPNKIFVRWDHPFTENNAHIIGAASIIANIDETNIVFLKKNEKEIIDNQEILLYWEPHERKYAIKQNY
ncbi:MAG: hypothetical protein HW405_952 [Candidatus Berkelbacteria bacterium]|nr:hypothetical protein [Candidatus Berkelbacteria bacterium]